MRDEFAGDPTPLSKNDFLDAAKMLGCSSSALQAVAQVESSGAGFLSDNRPKILFERHVFHRLTDGKYSAAHSAVSSPRPGGYMGGAREYDRLREAIGLNRKAALEAASWGKFQVMGFSHGSVGFSDVERFVKAMTSGEKSQLSAFVAFIKHCKLDAALTRLDWAAFARGYNGSAYAKNAYDRKMAAAYAMFSRGEDASGAKPVLKMGDMGEDVKALQRLLKIANPDGVFGPATKAAVMAFQTARKLYADGVVGGGSWRALLS